ncbi:MAG: hypothetical protein IJY02_02010, partial [Oscillospiraceae bacterium]|nr:hypothetical protein [Oscillospiraceae bacterium]
MLWNRGRSALHLAGLEEILQEEYCQTALLVRSGMDLCAELAPQHPDLWPDFAQVLRQGHDLARRAGSLQRLDDLWADPKVRRGAASACFDRDLEVQLIRRAIKDNDD